MDDKSDVVASAAIQASGGDQTDEIYSDPTDSSDNIPLRGRWERLIQLLQRVQDAAWNSGVDDPAERSRRESRVDSVMKALVETAPPGYFSDDEEPWAARYLHMSARE